MIEKARFEAILTDCPSKEPSFLLRLKRRKFRTISLEAVWRVSEHQQSSMWPRNPHMSHLSSMNGFSCPKSIHLGDAFQFIFSIVMHLRSVFILCSFVTFSPSPPSAFSCTIWTRPLSGVYECHDFQGLNRRWIGFSKLCIVHGCLWVLRCVEIIRLARIQQLVWR